MPLHTFAALLSYLDYVETIWAVVAHSGPGSSRKAWLIFTESRQVAHTHI